MLRWAAIFLVIALIAALLGFTGIAGAAAEIAKFLFFLFIAFFVILFLLAVFAGHADVRALQMVERECIGDVCAKLVADRVEHVPRRFLEFDLAQAERGIEQSRQNRK